MLAPIGCTIVRERDNDSQIEDIIRGVTELLKMPVRLYTNLPITIVLYLSLPDGVSATIG